MPCCGGEMGWAVIPNGNSLVCCVCSFRIAGYDLTNVIGRYDELRELVRWGKAAEKLKEKPPRHCDVGIMHVQGEVDLYTDGLSDGFILGRKACLDMLPKEGE
jgi:hypothetical protein